MSEDASLKTMREKLYQKTLLRSSVVAERDDLLGLVDDKNDEIDDLDTIIAELEETIGSVNPAPTVTVISPTYFVRGSSTTEITITGTGFVSGDTQAYVNGLGVTTAFVSSTVITCDVEDTELTVTGTVNVYVRTTTPGGGQSNTNGMPVINGTPTILTLTPDTIAAGADATEITIEGTSLYNTSVAYINGVARTTTLSGVDLLVTIPESALAEAGYISVFVTNPSPGGGQSEQLLFTVT